MGAVSVANLTRLRTTRHATKLGMVAYAAPIIWSARVNGTQDRGATAITVDGVVQVRAPQVNYLVKFGSYATADDLGTARFKSYAAPTLTVSTHNAALTDDYFITIVEEIKPVAILPTIDDNDVVTEDGTVAYTNENTQYQPLAKCGSHAVAYIDEGTGLATVSFYSRAEMFGGATLASCLWTWRGGTVTVGTVALPGTEGVPNVVTWDTPGSYYCSFQVTDTNGKTHTRYFVVFIRRRNLATYPAGEEVFYNLEVDGPEGDVESGAWRATLRVHVAYNGHTAIDNQSLIVLFAEDWWGDEAVAVGHETHRENIVFEGYIRRDTVKYDWKHGWVEFEVESVSGVMDNLWEVAGGLEVTSGDTTPGWHVLDSMTYNLAAHHVLTRHSTISQITDCYLNLPTYTAEYVDLSDGSIAENLRQICAAVRGRMGCSKEGLLYLEVNPQLTEPSVRSDTYVLSTTHADLRDESDLGEELYEKVVSQVDFSGEDANADPLFSLAPPNPWASGKPETIDGIRVADQTEANLYAGLYEGWRNNYFAEIVLPWRGNYRCFDIFPAEPLGLNLSPDMNPRVYRGWVNQRCWFKRITYEYRAGILLVTTVVEQDAYGPPGIANEFPHEPPEQPTPWQPPQQPPPWQPPPPPTPIIENVWHSKVYIATATKGVFYTDDFTGPGGAMPTWTAVNTGLAMTGSAVTGGLVSMRPDPYNPGTRQYVLTGETYARGLNNTITGKLYKRESGGAWTAVVDFDDLYELFCDHFGAAGYTGSGGMAVNWIECDINTDGYIAAYAQATCYASGWKYRELVWVSLDYGATWNVLNWDGLVWASTRVGQLFLGDLKGGSAQAAGQVVFLRSNDPSFASANRLYVSTDKGVTFPTNRGYAQFYYFQSDTYQDVLYRWNTGFNYAGNSDTPGLDITTDQGANWTRIFDGTPYIWPVSTGTGTPDEYGLHTYFPGNGTKATTVRFLAAANADGSGDRYLYKTANAGTSWTNNTLPATTTNGGDLVKINGLSLVHYSDGKAYLFGSGGSSGGNYYHHIYATDDEGATVHGKAGTDRAASTTTGIPNDAGGVKHILQVWTEA